MEMDTIYSVPLRTKEKQRINVVAAGKAPADLLLKNGKIVNVFTNRIEKTDVVICDGRIAALDECGEYNASEIIDVGGKVIVPGFIDCHIHLESSLVMPYEFVKATVPCGTTAVITDPHEIANVAGADGIEFMIDATEGLPIDVFFMLPSCVPSTPMDEAGAILEYQDIDKFYSHPRVLGLAEMMDFVGVVNGSELCLDKISDAELHSKLTDGHAPGLAGKQLNAYVAAGISSDHECSTFDEGLEKIKRGQFIMIREGTAAHNLDALMPLLKSGYGDRCAFCSDDKHPSDLISAGHIDELVRRCVEGGVDPVVAIKAASYNAARHYGLKDRGAIAPGFIADLVVADDLSKLVVREVFKEGSPVFDGNKVRICGKPEVRVELEQRIKNTFKDHVYMTDDFVTKKSLAVMKMTEGSLYTDDFGRAEKIDVSKDILKAAVIERHKDTGHIGIGYINGYGLKSGAVATSFAHDSHNIIVVGTSEDYIALAVNMLIEQRGGIVLADRGKVLKRVVLNIAGLMSELPLDEVNKELEDAKTIAFGMGVNPGIDPFMTLSFLSLPVIPKLKLTTRGVFDVDTQRLV